MEDARDIHRAPGGKCSSRWIDGAIAALAGRQHGIVARWQLIDLRIGRSAIDHRLACERLHRVHWGVYAVGHRKLTRRGRFMAAVLAGGRGAVLSHRSAAELWGVRQGRGSRIEVTAATSLRTRRGIEPHRATVPDDERTVYDGIPVTTVPRTLLDLAAVAPAPQVERALHEAEVLRLTDALSLEDLLGRYPRRPGTPAIRRLIATAKQGADVTRSELERRFLTLIAETKLPRPVTNAIVEGFEVDCVWRDQRLIVELDGHATHATRRGFEGDRARDRKLQAAGWRPVRLTWQQLDGEPEEVARDLAALLGGRASRRRRR